MEIFLNVERLIVEQIPDHAHEINEKSQIGLDHVDFHAFADEHGESWEELMQTRVRCQTRKERRGRDIDQSLIRSVMLKNISTNND